MKQRIISWVEKTDDTEMLQHLLDLLNNNSKPYPTPQLPDTTASEPVIAYTDTDYTAEQDEEWLKQPEIIYLNDEQKQGVLRGLEDIRMGRVLSHEEAEKDIERFFEEWDKNQ